MLVAAWVCALLWHWRGHEQWDRRVDLFEVVGVATLPLAVVAGVVDAGWEAVSSPRWDLPLVWHALVSLAATAVFLSHWAWRRRTEVGRGGVVAVIDVGMLTVGTWLLVLTGLIAGEMVYGS